MSSKKTTAKQTPRPMTKAEKILKLKTGLRSGAACTVGGSPSVPGGGDGGGMSAECSAVRDPLGSGMGSGASM